MGDLPSQAFDFVRQECQVLRQAARLVAVFRDDQGEMQQDGEQRQQCDEEKQGRTVKYAEKNGDTIKQGPPCREEEHETRGPQPQQGVAFLEATTPDGFHHKYHEQKNEDDNRRLENRHRVCIRLVEHGCNTAAVLQFSS